MFFLLPIHQDISGLSTLVNVRSLYLGTNKLEYIKELAGDQLTQPALLSLQSNRLTRLAGLEPLTALQELYVSSNGLTALDSLGTLVCNS